jgi:hypothetical protein
MEKRLYITTNLVNGKMYAGKHNWKEGTKYMGSGYALKKAFAKYGKDKFKIRWLKLKIKSSKDLDRLEIRLIKLLKYRYGNKCYNIQKGGCGGYFTYYMNEEEKQEVFRKISEGKKNQYARGATEAQLDGRIRANQKKKDQFKDPVFYDNFVNITVKKQIETRKKNYEQFGCSEKIKKWTKELAKYNVVYVTYKIIYPNGEEVVETNSLQDFQKKYITQDNVFSYIRQNGVMVFLQKKNVSKHLFPTGTKLYYISETKGIDANEETGGSSVPPVSD